MISFLKGKIAGITENSVVVDVNGFGMNVFMSTSDISKIGSIGEETFVNTYFYVRDEQPELYGFISNESLSFFHKLISISGIGPKAAISILGTLSAQELSLAIICDDVKAITRAPGVGTKMAQRIILELKGKISTEDAISQPDSTKQVVKHNLRADTEAVNALIALGASPSEAQKTIMQMDTSEMTAEDIIKEALRRMSNGI